MLSIGKPLLIAGILTFIFLVLSANLPQEFAGFTVSEETTIINATTNIIDTAMYLSADFIDWTIIKEILNIILEVALIFIVLKVFFFVIHWISLSQ